MYVTSDEITTGPDLPNTRFDGSCIVEQHDGKFLILGGYSSWMLRVRRFDPITQEIEVLPDMKARHGWTGCVLFYSAKHENRPVVYIGGGGGYTHGASESEILDYTKTNEWEKSECDTIHTYI